MNSRGWTLLRVLINQYHADAEEALMRYLSADDAEALAAASTSCSSWEALTGTAPESLETIHYSWLAPVVAEIDEGWRPYALASLPSQAGLGCAQLLGQQAAPHKPTSVIAQLLRQKVQTTFHERASRPPLATLRTTSPLSELLAMPKGKLLELVDLFAMQDVAEDVRNIVDKAKLKRLYHHLSRRQQRYLKMCLHQRDRSGAPKLGVENWNGDEDKLRRLLHRRGLARLARALAGIDSNQFWYLTRKLDTGRAKVLEKYHPEEQAPRVTESLRQHLVKLLDFMMKDHSE